MNIQKNLIYFILNTIPFILYYLFIYGPSFIDGNNSNLKIHDTFDAFFPHILSYIYDFKEYGFVLWNRHEILGGPAFTQFVSPINILGFFFLFLSPLFANFLSLFVLQLLAYWGFLVFSKKILGTSKFYYNFAAIVYICLVANYSESDTIHFSLYAGLPWLFVAFENYYSKVSYKNSLAMILALFAIFLSSNMAFSLNAIFWICIYFLFKFSQSPSLNKALGFGLILLTAILLYSPILLQFLFDIKESVRNHSTGADDYFGIRNIYEIYIQGLLIHQIPVSLLLIPFLIKRKDSRLSFFTWGWIFFLFLLGFLMGNEIGLRNWLGQYIPALINFQMGRILISSYFLFALFTLFLAGSKRLKKPTKDSLWMNILISFILVCYLIQYSFGEDFFDIKGWRAAFFDFTLSREIYGYRSKVIIFLSIVSMLLFSIFLLLNRNNKNFYKFSKYYVVSIIFLIMISAVISLKNNLAEVSSYKETFYLNSENVKYLKNDLDNKFYRIASRHGWSFTEIPQWGNYHNLASFTGRVSLATKRYLNIYTAIIRHDKEYVQLLRSSGAVVRYTLRPTDPYLSPEQLRDDIKLLGLFGTKYIISRDDETLAKSIDLKKKFERDSGNVILYENKLSNEKVFFTPKYEIFNSWEQLEKKLISNEFSFPFEENLLLKDDVHLITLPNQNETSESSKHSYKILTYSPDKIVIEANTTSPIIMVLNEAWHSDWKVTVNGKNSECFPSYNILRSVILPEGNKIIVEFKFKPIRMYIGFCISIVTILILFLVGFIKPKNRFFLN